MSALRATVGLSAVAATVFRRMLKMAGVGLDTALHHLRRAAEILSEIGAEQLGMPETHILQNLAIFQVETESTAERLEELIAEMTKAAA